MTINPARLLMALLIALATAAPAAFADGWLQSLGLGGRPATGDEFAQAARLIAGLPEAADAGRVAIAAEATEVGHWRLVNRAGEPLTAAGRDELHRGLGLLAPSAAGAPDRLDIYLTTGSVLTYPAQVLELPRAIRLFAVIDGRALPVARSGAAPGSRLHIEIEPRILLAAGDRATFDAARRALGRPVARERVRTLALTPGGATAIPRSPNLAPGTRRALPDAIDPSYLSGALGALDGQTALVSGRLEGDRLTFRSGSGAEGSLALAALDAAARAAGVNLVVLAATSARQPGERTWLWQRVEVGNVEKALGNDSLGAVLRSLAGDPKALIVTAHAGGDGRVALQARPGAASEPGLLDQLTGAISGTLSDVIADTAGRVGVTAIRAEVNRVDRQIEFERRLIPFLPSLVPWVIGGLLLAGLFGLRTASHWWARLWPPETSDDYGSAIGYWLAQAIRGGLFIAVFLPLAGLPALCVSVWRRLFRRPAQGDLGGSASRPAG